MPTRASSSRASTMPTRASSSRASTMPTRYPRKRQKPLPAPPSTYERDDIDLSSIAAPPPANALLQQALQLPVAGISRMVNTHGLSSFKQNFAPDDHSVIHNLQIHSLPTQSNSYNELPFDQEPLYMADDFIPNDPSDNGNLDDSGVTFGAFGDVPRGDDSDDEAGPGDETVVECTEKPKGIYEWIPIRESVLDQLLILDGALPHDLTCGTCGRTGEFRCTSCFGGRRFCIGCLLRAHGDHPLHFVEKWEGGRWRKITLNSLGYIFHLEHGGNPCPRPQGATRLMHLMHTTGLHDVRVSFCGCAPGPGYTSFDKRPYNQLLRARLFPSTTISPATAFSFECLNEFHLLTTQGKLNGMDYYESRIQLSDNMGIDPPNRKYEEFMKISRLWRHLKLIKRAGVHQREGGLKGCGPGSCAVPCYACPSKIDELDIPELFGAPHGDPLWTSAAFRQLDANFRLKQKERGVVDPSLNDGIATVVKEEPYKAHYTACGIQTETNICDTSLHAVDHANLRGGAAYRASGVGACQCRHMMVMPAGVGDLQKGERYSNMDYIFASSLQHFVPRRLVISYDIACQWYRNFFTRFENLPAEIRIRCNRGDIEFVIPKFHIAAHGASCQSRFSLNYRRFMGRTDGENIERGWAWMNPASLSTREMGPGTRHDTLDDQWASWNFRRLVRLGETLFRRLDEAVIQARSQRAIHVDFTRSFPPQLVERWSAEVDKWCESPFDNDIPNPFDEPQPEITVADVRRQLNAEEEADIASGVVPKHSVSASKYLVTGLALEDQQRYLKLQRDASKSSSTTRSLAAEDKEVELRRKIVQWKREVQPVYMLNRSSVASDDGDDVTCDVWDIPLNLPSSYSTSQRASFCSEGLVDKEHRLRKAQAEDALDELRRVLRSIQALQDHRATQTAGTGVAANTRMGALLAKHADKKDRLAERYRAARAALISLQPAFRTSLRLQELKPEHVRPPGKKGALGQGRAVMSWIWLTPAEANDGRAEPGDAVDEDGTNPTQLDEGLRVEWCRSLARAERWEEEVILIPIEMRRVLRGFVWKAREWRDEASRAVLADGKTARVRAGYSAYAEKQATYLEEQAVEFSSSWVSLFGEHGIELPEGWPYDYQVERRSSRRIKRRRERMKFRLYVLAHSNAPIVE